ncbi:MAG TPA: hypothetical protein VM243_03425 [Phycisphaerae bacterium]|nr:hypothetical protein [Phycisphaerae bacterium]
MSTRRTRLAYMIACAAVAGLAGCVSSGGGGGDGGDEDGTDGVTSGEMAMLSPPDFEVVGGSAPTYAWTQVSGPLVTLDDATAKNPSFPAPQVNEATVLGFKVEVTSGGTTLIFDVEVVVHPAADEAHGGGGGGDGGGDSPLATCGQVGGACVNNGNCCIGLTCNAQTNICEEGGVEGEGEGEGEEGCGGGPDGLVSVNGGGGALADRLGGATFTGDATGELVAGTLSLAFDADGVLIHLGGTAIGGLLGLPEQSEVFFDYGRQSVTGTYATEGGTRTLEEFLAESEQSIELCRVVVLLVGDSLSVRTGYLAELASHPTGEQTVELEATLRFQTDDELRGALGTSWYSDSQALLFLLQRD